MTDDLARPARPGATAFVLLTVAWSWTIWIATWWATGHPTSMKATPAMIAAVYAGSFGPGVAAAVLSARAGTLKEWARGFVRWRCGWGTYGAALIPLPLALLLLTVVLGYAPRVDALHGKPAVLLYLTVFPVAILNGVVSAITGAGPLGEEGGWRGYLLPRLLERGGEGRASLIVGVVWALWHLPIMAMFADWRGGVSFAAYLPLYTLGVVGLSFVLTRVWRIGGGSLIPCIWLHGVVNAAGSVAFNGDLWTSRWSDAAGTFHFAVAAATTAAFLWAATRGADPRPVEKAGWPSVPR